MEENKEVNNCQADTETTNAETELNEVSVNNDEQADMILGQQNKETCILEGENTGELNTFTLQLDQKGEDAEPKATDFYLLVCDGLGGSGAKMIQTVDEHGQKIYRSNAYYGSRICSDAVSHYFEENSRSISEKLDCWSSIKTDEKRNMIEGFLKGLKAEIDNKMASKLNEMKVEVEKGKTLKTFPTTLATAIYKKTKDGLLVICIWAGDSRVFFLNAEMGLKMLTLDDADKARESFLDQTTMNNVISANGNYHLNYAVYLIDTPGLLMACSDGCFTSDFLPSPISFEAAVDESIASVSEEYVNDPVAMHMEERMKNYLYRYLDDNGEVVNRYVDDTTMAGYAFNAGSIEEFKRQSELRHGALVNWDASYNEKKKELNELNPKYKKGLKNLEKARAKTRNAVHEKLVQLLLEGKKTNDELDTLLFSSSIKSLKNDLENKSTKQYEKEQESINVQINNLKKNIVPEEIITEIKKEENEVSRSLNSYRIEEIRNSGYRRQSNLEIYWQGREQFGIIHDSVMRLISMFKEDRISEEVFSTPSKSSQFVLKLLYENLPKNGPRHVLHDFERSNVITGIPENDFSYGISNQLVFENDRIALQINLLKRRADNISYNDIKRKLLNDILTREREDEVFDEIMHKASEFWAKEGSKDRLVLKMPDIDTYLNLKDEMRLMEKSISSLTNLIYEIERQYMAEYLYIDRSQLKGEYHED